EILLVVALCVVEGRGVRDLRRDRPVPGRGERFLVPGARGFRRLPLGWGEAIDRGAVLGADVVSLSHSLRRVVVLPEDAQHLLVARLLRIEDGENDLRVTREPRAHLLVRRIRRGAARVADGGREDSRCLPELALRAPEAAHADEYLLQPVGERRGE